MTRQHKNKERLCTRKAVLFRSAAKKQGEKAQKPARLRRKSPDRKIIAKKT